MGSGRGRDKPWTCSINRGAVWVPYGCRLLRQPRDSRPGPLPRASLHPPPSVRHRCHHLRPLRIQTHSKEVAGDSHTSFSNSKSSLSPLAAGAAVVLFTQGQGRLARERPALPQRAPRGAVGLGGCPLSAAAKTGRQASPRTPGLPTSGRQPVPLPFNLEFSKGGTGGCTGHFLLETVANCKPFTTPATPVATLPGGPSSLPLP